MPSASAHLQKGEVPILEAGLPELLAEGLASRRLRFVVGPADAARGADIVFLCVQTPQGADGSADLSFLQNAMREIAPVLGPHSVVVNKSTAPVGSTRLVQRVLSEAGVQADDVNVASNPEFLREGQSVRDFLHPDRIVIGCDRPEAAVRVSELYKGVNAPVLVTDPASAEMIKYASNAFLATKVSFINAIANCARRSTPTYARSPSAWDTTPVSASSSFIPGPAMEARAFRRTSPRCCIQRADAGYEFGVLAGVVEANSAQHERMVEKVRSAAGGTLTGAVVGLWGLTFKADTDDLRDSPAMVIGRRLLEEGATVQAYDPAAGERAQGLLPGLDLRTDAYDAAHGADVVLLVTEWDEFRWIDFERVANVMRHAAIVDGRNMLDPAALRRRGFTYDAVGRR